MFGFPIFESIPVAYSPLTHTGVISQELGTSKLFMVLVSTLSITVGVLFTFRKPYLNCVEITKRRSLSRHAAESATNGAKK